MPQSTLHFLLTDEYSSGGGTELVESKADTGQRISVNVHHTTPGYAAVTNDFTSHGAFK